MGNKINVNINGLFSLNCNQGVSVYELAHDYKKVTGNAVIGAKIGEMIVDYDTHLTEDTRIDFFDYTCPEGNKMYQAGLKFVMILAVRSLWNKTVKFKFSIDKGIYCEIDKKMSDENIYELKEKMEEIISYNYPIKKCVTRKLDAIKYYYSTNDIEKAENIINIPNNFVELYEIYHSYNYFYADMPMSTGELGIFDIKRLDKNALVLMYPRIDSKREVPEYIYNEKIHRELDKYSKWASKMDASYAADLNKKISASNIQMFIKMNNIFRYNVILKYKDDSMLYDILDKIIEHYKANSKIKIDIDFNPSQMM